ncbi:hypothetical protein PV04_02808 [Phialophora macrospora]|uniref:Uncharacterized protein n=1 Tax=Phialophora macrospora TaxID=1851006 RepID=A0A0D2FVP4_9EURO|nr:hypothetical protein PV04_02808 [Phialophora macrospora]
MSYSYTVTERKRKTTTSGGYGYSGSRSTFGYWVPLALTVTAATIGLAAWVWGERKDDEEDSSEDEHYQGGVPPSEYTMSGALPQQAPPPGGFQGPPGPSQMPPMPGPLQPGGFGPPPPGGFQGGPPPPGWRGTEEEWRSTARSTSVEQQQETGLVARMSSALGFGRSPTPSGERSQGQNPGQPYDWTNRPFASATAAAGAMVGAAISTLSGGAGEGYEDHERWSEEAEQRDNDRQIKQGIKRRGTADEFFSGSVELPRSASIASRKRKTVAVVVSAVGDADGDVGDHASVLSYLPEYIDPETTRIFVLIYAPDLKAHPLSSSHNPARRSSQSMASSFSNISQADVHTPAVTPGEFPNSDGILSHVDPKPIDESSTLFKTLYNQAIAIVDRDTMVLPYTSPNGHKHILRSLGPEVVYIQESLCGRDGEIVSDLSGWVRQTVIVIGDEGGHGGLIDTDDEGSTVGGYKRGEKWWQKEERTGVGRRVAVVESLKVGEDWERRINEKD